MIALAISRIMSSFHGPVVVGHGVEIVAVALGVVQIVVILGKVLPHVKVCQRKVDSGILLLEPATRFAEAIQVDDDYVRQLSDVELLCTVAWDLAIRAFPARDSLATNELSHAILEFKILLLLLIYSVYSATSL